MSDSLEFDTTKPDSLSKRLVLPLLEGAMLKGRKPHDLPKDRASITRLLKGKHSYEEIARGTGLNIMTVKLALYGQSNPSFRTGMLLSRYLGMSPWDLLLHLDYLKRLPWTKPQWRINLGKKNKANRVRTGWKGKPELSGKVSTKGIR
jgi:transcriptional regulator with XRE-family HTH domain